MKKSSQNLACDIFKNNAIISVQEIVQIGSLQHITDIQTNRSKLRFCIENFFSLSTSVDIPILYGYNAENHWDPVTTFNNNLNTNYDESQFQNLSEGRRVGKTARVPDDLSEIDISRQNRFVLGWKLPSIIVNILIHTYKYSIAKNQYFNCPSRFNQTIKLTY